jgi:hypothetical protein
MLGCVGRRLVVIKVWVGYIYSLQRIIICLINTPYCRAVVLGSGWPVSLSPLTPPIGACLQAFDHGYRLAFRRRRSPDRAVDCTWR